MIRESLEMSVVELVKEVKANKRNVTGVELVFNGSDFDFCINYCGISFIRPSNTIVVDLTEEVEYAAANDDINYLVALIRREIEDTLFFMEEVAEEV